MLIKKYFIIAFIIISIASCSKNNSSNDVSKPSLSLDSAITYDANKVSNQSIIDSVFIGTVGVGEEIQKRIYFQNNLAKDLTFSISDLSQKLSLAENSRFFIKSNTCGNVIKKNSVCFLDIGLKYIQDQDYLPQIETNVVSDASNSFFGKIILTGAKKSDVSGLLPLSNVLRLSQYSDSISLKSGTISKQYYINNISPELVKIPTLVSPIQGIIEKNTCDGISLKPNSSCYFKIKYQYDLSKGIYSDKISFSPVDARDVSGFEISLSMANNSADVAPVSHVSIVKVGSFASVLDMGIKRVYIGNQSSINLDLSSILIPSPFMMVASNCNSNLKQNIYCFIDYKIDSSKIGHMVSVSSLLQVANDSTFLTIGQPLSQGSIQCDNGFSLSNGICTISNGNLSYSQSCVLQNAQSNSIAGTQSTIDGGLTWSSCQGSTCGSNTSGSVYIALNGSCVQQVQQRNNCSTSPIDSNALLAGSIETSVDGGQSWQCSSFQCANGYTLRSDLSSGSSYYAGKCVSTNQNRNCLSQPNNSSGGFEISTDGGVTFDNICHYFICAPNYYVSGGSCLAQTELPTVYGASNFVMHYTVYNESNPQATSVDSLYNADGSSYEGTPTTPNSPATSLSSSVGSTIILSATPANSFPASVLDAGYTLLTQLNTDSLAYAKAYSVSPLLNQTCDMSNTLTGILCQIDQNLTTILLSVPKSSIIGSGVQNIKLTLNNGANYLNVPIYKTTISQVADTSASVPFVGSPSMAPSVDDAPVVKGSFTISYNGQQGDVLLFASNNSHGVQKLFGVLPDGTIGLISNTSGSAFASDKISTLFTFNNKVYLGAANSSGFLKLFKLEQDSVTLNGVIKQMSDLNPSGNDLMGTDFAEYNGKMYFACGGTVLKVCEMDSNETVRIVANTSGSLSLTDDPSGFVVFNNKLYFSSKNSSAKTKLFMFDGSNGKITQIKIINGSTGNDNFGGAVVYNGQLYFKALNGSFLKIFSLDVNNNVYQKSNITSGSNDVLGSGFPLRVINTDLVFAGYSQGSYSKIFKLDNTGSIYQLSNLNPTGSDNISGFFGFYSDPHFVGGASLSSLKLYRIGKGGFVRQLTDIVSGGNDFSYASAKGLSSTIYLVMKNSLGVNKLMKMEKVLNP